MDDDNLGELPKAYQKGWIYTPAQVRSYALAEVRRAVAAELERCAMLCESTYPELRDGELVQLPCFDGGADCATAIRGILAEKPKAHENKSWGHCWTCNHDKIPGERCARHDCPDRPNAKAIRPETAE